MHELIFQVQTLARGLWRFRWLALGIAWAVSVAGWLFVARMPDQYQATTRVYVDTASLLRPLLRGLAVETDVRQRLRLMTRSLLSRPNLEKVARMTDLDLKARTPEEMERLLNDLAARIRLRDAGRVNLYTISFTDPDPALAKRVVQSLLTLFVESSLGDSRRESTTALKFLEQQIAEYAKRLDEAERRLMEFKRRNVGLLPGQGGDYFSRLEKVQGELEAARLELRQAVNRRDELKRQLEDAEAADEYALVPEAPATTALSPLDARIQALQAKLDELLLKYTEQHPDVIELKRTIAALEEQKRKELEAMAAAAPGEPAPSANPVRQQLKLALAEADATVAALRVRVQTYERKLARLRSLVDTIPKVEAELKRLTRDYAVTKRNYEQLLARRESAKISEEAQQTADDVKFRVIDPPRVPLEPVGPNRVLLMSTALGIGVAAGLAFALLLTQLRPTFDTRRALRQATGLPVLGGVMLVQTLAQRMRRRMEVAGFALAALLLVLAYGGVLTVYVADLRLPAALQEIAGRLL
ncbi:MAG TPA: chain length-determining protein [Chromatiales bacterium]|nr:chain length-determining protein [Chromatiales bacterium]